MPSHFKVLDLQEAGIPVPDGFDPSRKSFTLKCPDPAATDVSTIGILPRVLHIECMHRDVDANRLGLNS